MAAIVKEPSRHLKMVPSRINFPRKTSNGSFTSCRPNGVSSSVDVSALTSINASTARRMFFDEGGSSASDNASSAPPKWQILTRRTKSCKDKRSISGVCSSAIYVLVSDSVFEQSSRVISFYKLIMTSFGKEMKT